MDGSIKLATAQFDVSGDLTSNFKKISDQIKIASKENVDLIHFSECCLCGYPDIDIKNCKNDPQIDVFIRKIRQLAKGFKIAVIFGSHYFEGTNTKPFNSLFVIDSSGNTICRYDKRILAGAPGKIDQAHYIPGSEPQTFELNGIECGLIICHEWRYPELFREYQKRGVSLLFHSFYDGNLPSDGYKEGGIELGELIMGSERGNAANNYFWISVSNTSKNEQVFPSAVIRPDGSIKNRSQRNEEGIIITTINTTDKFIDPSKYGRRKINELFS